jgi:hypothetical protein
MDFNELDFLNMNQNNKQDQNEVKENEEKNIKKEEPNYILQTVLFPKDRYTQTEAIEWLKKNGLKWEKVDIKDNYLRYRQRAPSHLKYQLGLKNVKTVQLKKSGILKIIFYKE